MVTPSEVTIKKMTDTCEVDKNDLLTRVNQIFYETASTTTFPNSDARLAFHERWLGRYLNHYPLWFYIAVARYNTAVGYLAGCPDNPATCQLFDDFPYYRQNKNLMARYPAHFHINLTAHARGSKIGSSLVETYLSDLASLHVPGVHVVTDPTQRNVSFYRKNNFSKVGEATFNQHPVVFLGRSIENS